MARRKRRRRIPTYTCKSCGLGGLSASPLMKATGMAIGSTVLAKLAMWGVALYLLKRASTAKSGSNISKASEVATRIASPPEFLAQKIVPSSVQRA